MDISKDIFIENPALLLKKDRAQVFDALCYLNTFINTLSSKEDKIPPSKLEKTVDVVSTRARIVAYSTFTGYLCTSLAKEIISSSPLLVVNSILNDTNTLIFGALYGLAAVQNAYQLAQDQNLSDLLRQEDALALKALIQNIPISSRLDQLKASWSRLAPKDQETKKQHFKQRIQKLLIDSLKNTPLPSSNLDEFLQILQAQESSNEMHQLLGLTDKEYWNFTPLEVLGLLVDQYKEKKSRWVQIKEGSSFPVVQAVDKAYRRGLLERVNSGNKLVQKNAKKEMKELMGRIRIESTKTKKIHTALLIINLLGGILAIVGVLTLPFGVGISLSALSFLITTASIGSKVYLAKKNLLSDVPCGKYDKAIVVTIAMLLGISLIVLTGITIHFGLSFIQLGVALGIDSLGMGFLGYYYHLLTQKDALWKQAHPSLEVFQKFISEKERWDQAVHDLFKKLPKDVRMTLRQQYVEGKDLPNNPSLRNKILALKKTSKYFWNQWLISGLEEDRVLALEIQSIYEEAKIKRLKKNLEQQNALENHLKQVLENPQVKDQWEKDLKYVFYRKSTLNRLSKDLNYIYEVNAIASQKILAKSLSSKKRLV